MAKLLLAEGAAPDTPASGKVAIYAKADGKLYWRNDSGTEYAVQPANTILVGSSGPGPQTGVYDPETDTGYFGEVSAAEIISGADLAENIGLTAGIAHNTDTGWFKFYVGPNASCNRGTSAYVLFVAKKTFRYSISWDQINTARAVDGSGGLVGVGKDTFKVRLLTGANTNPSTYGADTACADNAGAGSEWNALLYRVHADVPSCDDVFQGMPFGSETTRHGGPQEGNNWASFGDNDVGVIPFDGFGRATWCQEVDGTEPTYRIWRGSYGIAGYRPYISSSTFSNYGWRPCLQLVVAETETLLTDRTYYVNSTTGDDANDGLTAGNAFATVQHACEAAQRINNAGYTITIQLADGDYGPLHVVGSFTGGGKIIVQGNTSDSNAVIFNATFSSSYGLTAVLIEGVNNVFEFRWLSVKNVSRGIISSSKSDVRVGDIIFDAVGFCLWAYGSGTILLDSEDITFKGTNAAGFICNMAGIIDVVYSTITLDSVPHFSGAFGSAYTQSIVRIVASTIIGTATGKRYSSVENSVVSSQGGGETFFPGDVAGTVATGGVYV